MFVILLKNSMLLIVNLTVMIKIRVH